MERRSRCWREIGRRSEKGCWCVQSHRVILLSRTSRISACYVVSGDHDSPAFYVNDGTRDVGSTPTQILLLRGLDPLTSEEDIVAVLGNMSGRAGIEVREGRGVKKVFITKDRASRSSWGYAFVQFADVRVRQPFFFIASPPWNHILTCS